MQRPPGPPQLGRGPPELARGHPSPFCWRFSDHSLDLKSRQKLVHKFNQLGHVERLWQAVMRSRSVLCRKPLWGCLDGYDRDGGVAFPGGGRDGDDVHSGHLGSVTRSLHGRDPSAAASLHGRVRLRARPRSLIRWRSLLICGEVYSLCQSSIRRLELFNVRPQLVLAARRNRARGNGRHGVAATLPRPEAVFGMAWTSTACAALVFAGGEATGVGAAVRPSARGMNALGSHGGGSA